MYIHVYMLPWLVGHLIKLRICYIVVTWAQVVCLICTPRAAGPRTEGVHIRQTISAHVTTVMCHGPSYWLTECSLYKQAGSSGISQLDFVDRKLISGVFAYGTFEINHGQSWFTSNVP